VVSRENVTDSVAQPIKRVVAGLLRCTAGLVQGGSVTDMRCRAGLGAVQVLGKSRLAGTACPLWPLWRLGRRTSGTVGAARSVDLRLA
jgi:hypothetical protein